MKDVYFNELSVAKIIDLNELESLLDKYARVIKEARIQGFEKVRYENGVNNIMLNQEYSLGQFVHEHTNLQSVNVLLATQSRPYIPDGDYAEDAYIMNNYCVDVDGLSIKCEGIISAAIHNSISIGFENPDWNKNSYIVTESCADNVRYVTVLYAYSVDFFSTNTFQLWSDKFLPPTILSTDLFPLDKNIHLSPHHGYDTLMKFAKRIRKENYVKEILNSIDRDSNQKQFARGKEGTNTVEITLINDGGYGLVISTTARNDRELRYITKLITDKYS